MSYNSDFEKWKNSVDDGEDDEDIDSDIDSGYDDFDWDANYPNDPRWQLIKWAMIRQFKRLGRRIKFLGRHDPYNDIPF